jgi:hypothetical protein
MLMYNLNTSSFILHSVLYKTHSSISLQFKSKSQSVFQGIRPTLRLVATYRKTSFTQPYPHKDSFSTVEVFTKCLLVTNKNTYIHSSYGMIELLFYKISCVNVV